MSTAQLLLTACGMLTGLGLFLIVRELVTQHPRLDAAIANLTPLTPDVIARARRDGTGSPPPATAQERVGAWVETRLAGRPGVRAPVRDLDILGRTTGSFYGEKALSALVGFTIPTVAGALLPLLGLGIPVAIPFGLALAFAVVLWVLPDAQVRSRAADARQDFAYAAVSYLRLVAVHRVGGMGLLPSMEAAAAISDGWMFARIREELLLARWSRREPWDALEALGLRLGVPELREVADITKLSQHGAGVTDNLMARAASLHNRLTTTEHKNAVDANTGLTLPIGVLLFLFIIALIYPAAIAILG